MIYILPAGIGCDMIKEIQSVNKIETILTTKDEVTVYKDIASKFNKILDVRDDGIKEMLANGKPANNTGILANINSRRSSNNSNGGN